MGSDSSFDTKQVQIFTKINALNIHYFDDHISNFHHNQKLYYQAVIIP